LKTSLLWERRGISPRSRKGTAAISSFPRNWPWRPPRPTLRHLEQKKDSFLQKATQEKHKAAELAARIEQLPCTLARPAGESDKLFGSVTTLDLNKFLQEQGISLDRRKIHLPNPIKTLGSYTVALKLHPEVTAQLKVNVVAASPADREKA
jgi:large subunit ribosomal protein L9